MDFEATHFATLRYIIRLLIYEENSSIMPSRCNVYLKSSHRHHTPRQPLPIHRPIVCLQLHHPSSDL